MEECRFFLASPPKTFWVLRGIFCQIVPLCVSSRHSVALIPSRSQWFCNCFCINLHLSVIRLHTLKIHVGVQIVEKITLRTPSSLWLRTAWPLVGAQKTREKLKMLHGGLLHGARRPFVNSRQQRVAPHFFSRGVRGDTRHQVCLAGRVGVARRCRVRE